MKYVIHVYAVIGTKPNIPYTKYGGKQIGQKRSYPNFFFGLIIITIIYLILQTASTYTFNVLTLNKIIFRMNKNKLLELHLNQ